MILGLLLFIIGIFIGIKKRTLVPYYFILWITLIPFLLDLIFPFKDIENLYEMRTYATYYLFFILIYQISLSKNSFLKFLRENHNILIYILLILMYLFFLSMTREVGFNYFVYLRRNISHILLFFYLTLYTPTGKSLFKFIIITLGVQIVIGLLQEFSYCQFSFNTHSPGVVVFLTGAMTGNNLYADYLAVITTILILECLSSKANFESSNKFFLYVLILICSFLIFDSGIRISLLSLIIAIGLVFLRFNRKLSIVLIVIGIIIISFPEYLNKILSLGDTVSYDWKVTSNSERQGGLLGVLKGWDYIQYSTLAYSVLLIVNYFVYSPIFGAGLYFKAGGYGGVVSSLTANQTDVTAALFLTEFGIIGVLLLFLIYKSIIYKYKEQIGNNYFSLLLLFFIILIQTLTDSGIFDISIMSYFYLYYFYLKQQNLSIT